MIKSTDSTIENGTVLVELKEKSEKEFVLLYYSSHILVCGNIKPKEGELINGFIKNGKEIVNKRNYDFEAKKLNENVSFPVLRPFEISGKSNKPLTLNG